MKLHVRTERERRGITLETMAADLRDRHGWDPGKDGLSKRETQKIRYKAIEIYYICLYLGVPLDHLIELEPHEQLVPCQKEPAHV